MKRLRKFSIAKTVSALLAVMVVLMGATSVQASTAYYSYTYSYTDGTVKDVAAPLAYETGKVYTQRNLNCTVTAPEDLLDDAEGNFYMVDSKENCVYKFDKSFNLINKIAHFTNEKGEEDGFLAPTGAFVDAKNNLYIADTDNERIVVLDGNGKLIKIVVAPETDVLDSNFVFKPCKIAVDTAGRMFVLVKNLNKGLMQFSPDGTFVGYIGSNKVVYTMSQLLWKSVMTEAQRKKLLSFVPVEYSNISMDESGFIYAVTSASDTSDPIRRLNPSGEDVLVHGALSGSTKISGDVIFTADPKESVSGPSAFVDITQDDRGNYYALDSKRGRIFSYDDEGNLLFIFGGLRTDQRGSFSEPGAILYHDDNLYVLDKAYGSITEFVPTEYVEKIHEATNAYLIQDYEKSVELWNDVIRLNSNFDLAYMKAGYAYYRLKNYDKAMEYFKIANAKSAYSKVYIKAKKIRLNQQLPYYIVGVVCLTVLCVVLVGIRKRRKTKKSR